MGRGWFSFPVYETMTPTRSQHIRRGTPGRDEELLDFIAAVEAMGQVGIPVLCYNLGAGGSRTDWVPTRGGAISSQFDYAESHQEPSFGGTPNRGRTLGQSDLATRTHHPRRRKGQCPHGLSPQRSADFAL